MLETVVKMCRISKADLHSCISQIIGLVQTGHCSKCSTPHSNFHYIRLGIQNTTDNQLSDFADPAADKIIMLSLMSSEIGGFLVLLIGFFIRVF